jgi:hypothetical protein
MRRIPRQASLVVALLLASVGTASAESWVLWQQLRACREDSGEYEYDRIARLTHTGCETYKPKTLWRGKEALTVSA